MPEPFRTELSARTEGRRRFLIDLLYTGVWIAFLVLAVACAVKWALPFLLAFAVAALFQRPIRWLVGKTGVKRQFFSVALLVLMILLLAGLLLFLGWSLAVWVTNFLTNEENLRAIETWIGSLTATVQDLLEKLSDRLSPEALETVNNAVAGGCDAIIVAANGPDAISSALNEASAAGVKIVYVDSPANVPAEATFSTDNTAAGTTAGQTMLDELSAKGITSGKIGIVNVNAATASTVAREAGFRAAFDGTDFELLETQYGEGDAAKSQAIAENYITQGVVGIFGCNEGSTNGAGNAVKAAGADVVCVGFDKSDAILGLIDDGYILATMAQNPDVMGYEGVKAAVAALNGENLGGAVTDTGVSVLTK